MKKKFLLIAVILAIATISSIAQNYLTANGSKLYDVSGKEVRLTGVNWFGFETSALAPHGLWSRDCKSMLKQIKSLGFNCIRLPWCNKVLDPAATINLSSYGTDPFTGVSPMNAKESNLKKPIELMDLIIQYCQELNLKVILDNHSKNPDGYLAEELWYTSNVPESKWISDWVFLADRYKSYDAVIACDLKNEPHGKYGSGASWGNTNPATDWNKAAEKCGNAVLAANSNVLILVEGIENYNNDTYWWGGNMRGVIDYPIILNKQNKLVYSPHEYGPTVYAQSWFNDPTFPANMPTIWEKYFNFIITQNIAPLLIGEFGLKSQGGKDEIWFDTFLNYMGVKYSWTFWCWNPNSGDTGGLLDDQWSSVVTWKVNKLKPYMAPEIPNGNVGPVNHAPVAKAQATPTSGNAPLAVSLSATGSSDADGDALTYSWTFGDGTSGNGLTVNHTYSTKGSYIATVSVNDGKISSTASVTITVTQVGGNNSPVAKLTATPVTGNSPLVVALSGTGSTDADGDALTYSWTFGDGTTGTGISANHTYAAGTYTVTLTVNDGKGGTGNATTSITAIDGGGNCKFGTPAAAALPTINKSYSKMHVLGTGGPNLSNVTSFVINWDLPNKGLWQFSFNTSNGMPTWWLDLLPKITQTFASTSPSCKITGSGITGFDGDYWVNMDGANFVMVSKSGNFTIYGSNSTTPPACTTLKSAEIETSIESNTVNSIAMYPNPLDKNGILSLNLRDIANGANYTIVDLSGKTILAGALKTSENYISVTGKLNNGIYFVKISNGNEQFIQKLIVK